MNTNLRVETTELELDLVIERQRRQIERERRARMLEGIERRLQESARPVRVLPVAWNSEFGRGSVPIVPQSPSPGATPGYAGTRSSAEHPAAVGPRLAMCCVCRRPYDELGQCVELPACTPRQWSHGYCAGCYAVALAQARRDLEGLCAI